MRRSLALGPGDHRADRAARDLGPWSASGDTFYFPPLTDILQKFQELWLFDRVGSDVLPSLERLFLGYAIACVVAVAVGIPLGLSPLLRRATSPIVEFLRRSRRPPCCRSPSSCSASATPARCS